MHWYTYDIIDDDNRDIRGFFNRLPSTLTTLVLKDMSHLEYIPSDSNIETLILRYLKNSDINALFRKLTPNLQGWQTVKPLPRLKRITIRGRVSRRAPFVQCDILPQRYSIMLVEMLERRLDDIDNSFVFGTERTVFTWEPGAKTGLERLTNKGYDIRNVKGFEEGLWI